uniref:Uncharacterized protein n=1 Tax=Zea mays TaxID=4577 RepID=A0A804PKM2_MAIZE
MWHCTSWTSGRRRQSGRTGKYVRKVVKPSSEHRRNVEHDIGRALEELGRSTARVNITQGEKRGEKRTDRMNSP